jgi:uncharacterized lipoprotein NlpE involved in copper resistance
MKMNYLKAFFVSLSFVSLISCGENKKEAEAVPEEVTPAFKEEHTAQNSLDYTGTYSGVTPCADCEGIEVNLTIKADSTYNLSMKYLGKGDGVPVIREGSYTWVDGSTIQLGGITDGASKFFVGENQIWQLDMSGKKVEGALADKYILKKI